MTAEPGRLQSMGSQTARYDRAHMHIHPKAMGLKINDKRLILLPLCTSYAYMASIFPYAIIFLIKKYTIQQDIYNLTHVQ